MKIILAIDDSPHSQAALQWVQKAHWPAGSNLLVLSAVEWMAYAMAEPGGADLYGRLLADQVKAREEVIAGAERDLKKTELQVTCRVLQGDARLAILEAADQEHADLIVVGSHGRTGLPKLIMGSVASYVVAHAPCNVLVVKQPHAARGTERRTP